MKRIAICKDVCAASAQNASTALVPSVSCETEKEASSAYTTSCTVEESTPSSNWPRHKKPWNDDASYFFLAIITTDTKMVDLESRHRGCCRYVQRRNGCRLTVSIYPTARWPCNLSLLTPPRATRDGWTQSSTLKTRATHEPSSLTSFCLSGNIWHALRSP